MVLVAVGDDEAFDFVDVFFQICYIWDDQVDTEHVVFRECKSAVYDDDTVFILENGDVHTDLFQTAKRYNF